MVTAAAVEGWRVTSSGDSSDGGSEWLAVKRGRRGAVMMSKMDVFGASLGIAVVRRSSGASVGKLTVGTLERQ